MRDIQVSLADEVRHLHRSLFRIPLDPAIIKRYEAANTKIISPSGNVSDAVTRVISRKLDVEAVEYALRRRGMGRELTTKLQILCYLVEARRSYQSEFINFKKSRAKAVLALASGLIRTGWKLVKGEYLIREHGLL